MRLVGTSAIKRPPLGVATFTPDGEAWLVAPSAEDVSSLARELPVAQPGTLVILLPHAAPARGLWSLLSAPAPLSRHVRASALLARGFVELGACVDAHTKLDLVWGRAR